MLATKPQKYLPLGLYCFKVSWFSVFYSLWTNTMNRCTPPLTARPHLAGRPSLNRLSRHAAAFLLLAAAACLSGPAALAQSDDVKPNIRKFPPAALRGDMVVLAPPEIAMNGKPDRLSPGVRIRDMNDQLVLSGPLVNQPLVVNYLRDNTGQVQQVWILNSEEAREKRRGILDIIFNWGSDTTAAPVDDGKTPYGQLPAYQP